MIIINGLFGTPTAIFFSIVITLVFVVAVIAWFSAETQEKRAWIIARAPGILTALGLFGTFWGVAVGLGGFNSRNIDASIPVLLDGLKLAFWTSILGMFYAECINIGHYFIRAFSVQEDMTQDQAQKLYAAVNDAANSLKASGEAQARHIEGVTRTLEALLRQAAKDAGGVIGKDGAIEFKDFTQRIHELTENLASSLESSARNIEEVVKTQTQQQQKAAAELKTSLESLKAVSQSQAELVRKIYELNQRLAASLGALAGSLEKSANAQAQHITNITLELQNTLQRGAQEVENTFNRTDAAIRGTLEKGMDQFAGNTQTILTEVLQTMANSLASIDAKMIEDIAAITQRFEFLSMAAMRQNKNERRQ